MGERMNQLFLGTAVALMLAVPVAMAGEQGAMTHSDVKDGRTAIALDSAGRSLVLAEMRQFLTAVQVLTDALARDDLKAAALAARAVGMQAAHEVPPEVKARLPKEFKQLGFSVHSDFDQLALDADGLGDQRHALKQMSGILQKCVACHSTYRIDAAAPSLAKR